MDTNFRRTIALASDRKDDLEQIKAAKQLRTDTAAIDFAIRQSASLARRDPSEIKDAFKLWDYVNKKADAGGRLIIEEDGMKENLMLLIP